MMNRKTKIGIKFGAPVLILVLLLCFFSDCVLTWVGTIIVKDEKPVRADAVVVLNTGMDYYPRLIEAAALYKQGFVKRIVINGNRKTDTLRALEKKGYKPCCPWYESAFRILEILGTPRKDMMAVSAEDAYDTVSEAQAVGPELLRVGISRIIIATSKSHTRRAGHIWRHLWRERLTIRTVAAQSDPYLPNGWWKSGRQIRWVLAEYGAWIYFYWKRFSGI